MKGIDIMYEEFNPIRKRNTLLLTGIAFLIVAASKKPSLLLFFSSAKAIAHTFLIIFAGLFGAFGFREFGDVFLKPHDIPWYARRNSFLLLLTMVTIYYFMITFINYGVLSSSKLGPVFAEKAYLYEFFGFTFIWIVTLEWISCRK